MQKETSIFLPTQTSVKVHPVVIFNILDHYIRRNVGQDRVIGTLLGFNNDGVIEIRNCFPVVHSEGEQIAVEMEFHRKMLDLHLRSSPREPIVGWYATGGDINENSVIINNFYREELNGATPIHLTVDTGLTNDTMGIHAYNANNLSLNSETSLGSYFTPLPLEILTFEAENAGVDSIAQTKYDQQSTSLLSELESLQKSLSKLDEMLDSISNYIVAVENGQIQGDPHIGRFLAKTIQALPKANAQVMDKVINNSVKDLLMIVYISSLTRSQLAVAEKSPLGRIEIPDKKDFIIGRAYNSDLRIHEHGVSEYHSKLTRDKKGNIRITNLSTINSTKVNDKEIKAPFELKDSDVITIIGQQFQYHTSKLPTTPKTPKLSNQPLSEMKKKPLQALDNIINNNSNGVLLEKPVNTPSYAARKQPPKTIAKLPSGGVQISKKPPPSPFMKEQQQPQKHESDSEDDQDHIEEDGNQSVNSESADENQYHYGDEYEFSTNSDGTPLTPATPLTPFSVYSRGTSEKYSPIAMLSTAKPTRSILKTPKNNTAVSNTSVNSTILSPPVVNDSFVSQGSESPIPFNLQQSTSNLHPSQQQQQQQQTTPNNKFSTNNTPKKEYESLSTSFLMSPDLNKYIADSIQLRSGGNSPSLAHYSKSPSSATKKSLEMDTLHETPANTPTKSMAARLSISKSSPFTIPTNNNEENFNTTPTLIPTSTTTITTTTTSKPKDFETFVNCVLSNAMKERKKTKVNPDNLFYVPRSFAPVFKSEVGLVINRIRYTSIKRMRPIFKKINIPRLEEMNDQVVDHPIQQHVEQDMVNQPQNENEEMQINENELVDQQQQQQEKEMILEDSLNNFEESEPTKESILNEKVDVEDQHENLLNDDETGNQDTENLPAVISDNQKDDIVSGDQDLTMHVDPVDEAMQELQPEEEENVVTENSMVEESQEKENSMVEESKEEEEEPLDSDTEVDKFDQQEETKEVQEVNEEQEEEKVLENEFGHQIIEEEEDKHSGEEGQAKVEEELEETIYRNESISAEQQLSDSEQNQFKEDLEAEEEIEKDLEVVEFNEIQEYTTSNHNLKISEPTIGYGDISFTGLLKENEEEEINQEPEEEDPVEEEQMKVHEEEEEQMKFNEEEEKYKEMELDEEPAIEKIPSPEPIKSKKKKTSSSKKRKELEESISIPVTEPIKKKKKSRSVEEESQEKPTKKKSLEDGTVVLKKKSSKPAISDDTTSEKLTTTTTTKKRATKTKVIELGGSSDEIENQPKLEEKPEKKKKVSSRLLKIQEEEVGSTDEEVSKPVKKRSTTKTPKLDEDQEEEEVKPKKKSKKSSSNPETETTTTKTSSKKLTTKSSSKDVEPVTNTSTVKSKSKKSSSEVNIDIEESEHVKPVKSSTKSSRSTRTEESEEPIKKKSTSESKKSSAKKKSSIQKVESDDLEESIVEPVKAKRTVKVKSSSKKNL
eukprot:gene3611-4495_t